MEEQAKQRQTWWQKVRRPLTAIGIIAACIGVVVLIFIVVWFYGTGFTGKTLWDWLQLLGVLAIPVVVGFGAAWFTRVQQRRDQESAEKLVRDAQEAAEKRAQIDREISEDNQRETALQAYIDKISDLLLQEHLGELTSDGKVKPEYERVRNIARVRTLTTLSRLDSKRKGSVLQFLYEAGLIYKDSCIIDLSGADLSEANLLNADLDRAHLNGTRLNRARLNRARLSGAKLYKADLSDANLSGANLSEAYLRLANLSGADLSGADLRGTYLSEANLSEANLSRANLSFTNLNEADLSRAELNRADLSRAELNRADLSRANLKGAIGITIEELEKKAKSLQDTTMADGSKHP